MNNENSILSAYDVSRSFQSPGGPQVHVLQAVTFDVFPGESVSIQGQSGSGKSTLLNILADLDVPTRGEVHWQGERLVTRHPDVVRKLRSRFMGFVFQSYYLIPELSALENVLLAARISRVYTGRTTQKAKDLLKALGLGSRLHACSTELSGGERQRVAIARALIHDPKLILADEPTGNLDEKSGNQVMDLLLGLCQDRGASLILVTHNPVYAKRTDRALILSKGILTAA